MSKCKIASDNDLFRTTMLQSKRHRIVLSEVVCNLDEETKQELIGLVRSFNNFTEGNDPHKEHDLGRIELKGEDYFWKIDYYDESFEYGGDPQSGPVNRVLTIFRADEY